MDSRKAIAMDEERHEAIAKALGEKPGSPYGVYADQLEDRYKFEQLSWRNKIVYMDKVHEEALQEDQNRYARYKELANTLPFWID